MSKQVLILSERMGPSTDHERINSGAGLIFSPASNLAPHVGHPTVGSVRLENDHIITKDGAEISTQCPFDQRLVLDPHELDATTGRSREVASIVGMR